MIIAHFVKERAKTAQFIIISLREQMFKLADLFIGIFKVNDCTKNVVTSGVECVEDAATAIESQLIIGTDAEEKSVIRNKLRRRLEEDETDNVAAPKRAQKVM
uniref:Uncharacterized protein n=1 Tax=Panagrolaimus sp. PS1159 TaxID=55785 RepID=A0AC35GCC3_9BILA